MWIVIGVIIGLLCWQLVACVLSVLWTVLWYAVAFIMVIGRTLMDLVIGALDSRLA